MFTKKWIDQVVSWFVHDKPLFLIQFDTLKADMTHIIKEAVSFLDLSTSTRILKCTVKNSEGTYHRAKPYNQTQLLAYPRNYTAVVDHYKQVAEWYIKRRCPRPPWCLPHSKVNYTGQPDIDTNVILT